MEIEKPFKCNVCNAHFTNEDHLQVHKRRHEMSLNLNKSGNQQQSSLLDGFVDETPTPTRFFRNCEEVGLFQDLQNVNPFDEQFSKASATPSSGGEPFDFSLAMSSSTVGPSLSATSAASSIFSNIHNTNKRRYSDQDTLNTPQVLGFVVNATSSTTNTCSTSSILTPMPPSSVPLESSKKLTDSTIIDESMKNRLQTTESETISSTSNPIEVSHDSHENVGTVIATVSSDGIVKLASKSKANLRLKVSPAPHVLEDSDSSDSSKKAKPTSPQFPEKKAELLERNRAAASRSRQRRKQWVCSLESKCQTLEAMLSQTRAELAKQNSDNQMLRNELTRHANCDVSRLKNHTSEITILVQQPVNQPNILRQIPQTILTAVSQSGVSTSSQQLTSQSPVVVVIPRNKAKRGRPRKGNERRIDPLTVQPRIPESTYEIPFKVQIQPVSRTITTNLT